MKEMRNAYKIQDNIKMDHMEIGLEGVDWIYVGFY
jgi:hypothetical protein